VGRAGRAELRYQVQPGDNTAPSERTEALVTADATHLFVAFLAPDSEPGSVRARVGGATPVRRPGRTARRPE
jgi:hypothetical protein